MAFISAFLEIFQKPTIGDMMIELMGFMAPIWIAVFVGVLVGWAWKPKWASLKVDLIDCTAKEQESSSSSGSGMVFLQFPSIPSMNSLKLQVPSCVSSIFDFGFEKDTSSPPSIPSPDCSSSKLEKERTGLVNEDDLKDLHQLVEEKDGGPAWIQMMDRSTPNMSYQAWRRDPENGPPQYRSRTVYEDATPEMVRDFFWDDEFRAKWDDMLVHAETLEECPTTGTMMVQWVRKFPFFCSDREYIIGRRIWESGRSYYCLTKAVPCSSLPRRNKPRRVDVYFSSWCIRAVESKRDGQLTACEVLLFHHEDMGIPWEIAKLGIRQGMWGAVKKIDPALRAYQKHIASGASLSHCASMAQINTKVSLDTLDSLGSTSTSSEVEALDSESKPSGRNIPKFLIVGGAIVLACSLDRGLLTKAVIFGVARRFANIGRRL
ncbi:uncharacterized protein LOC111387559 isoform X1 [Olea europaea var. sylvestris]|uniref:uncharacterized protein LOC111387559 isoform X1 n=1 Tax=Olea europaea var. sylvestris TaxID=158386 RepID=UPI000C1D6F96|nr:uncharacterized protein LOC111387559 isoform X1 [Olea europaea var. sylvestris]